MRESRRIAFAVKILLILICVSDSARPAWQLLGPFGGSAQGVRVAPSEPDTIVVFTHDAQVFASNNRGGEWKRRPFPAEHQSVMHALVIHPKNPRLWFAGIENESGLGVGMFRTVDSGGTWSAVQGMKGQAVWSIAISLSQPDIVVAGTAEGVFRSVDEGESWKRISAESYVGLRPVVSLAIDPMDPSRIFAGTTHLPWRSTNGGATWQSIHTGMLDDSDVFSVAVNPRNNNIVYASACSGAYRSANGGALWARLPTPKGTFRTYVVAVDPKLPSSVYAGTSSGLLRSTNEGRSWTRISDHAVYSIDFDPGPRKRVYFASVSGGILASDDDGATVLELSKGFGNRQWVSIAGSDKDLFAASVQNRGSGLYKSSDLGQTWSRLKVPGADEVRLVASDVEGTLYAATRNSVFRSQDGGTVWSAVGSSTPTGTIDALAVRNNNVLFASGSKLYLNGKAAVDSGISGRIRSVRSTGPVIVASGRTGAAFSVDQGVTWRQCQLPHKDAEWYDVVPVSGGHLLAATSHGLFRSSDGTTWTEVIAGFSERTVSALVKDEIGEVVFASGRNQLFRSVDGGLKWTVVTSTTAWASLPAHLVVLRKAPDRIFGLFSRGGVGVWPFSGQEIH